MTTKQREEIVNLVKKFINDNMGNRINEWNGVSLLNAISKITEGMLNPSEKETEDDPLPPPLE